LTAKIILMAHMVQNICLIERCGKSNKSPIQFQKVPSVSPPCHAKVTLLMQEFCDPMSASVKCFCCWLIFPTCWGLNLIHDMSRWVRKLQKKLIHDYGKAALSSMRNTYLWYEGKNGKVQFSPWISMLKICDSTLIM
jgi:hypothetical protein